MSSAFSSKDSAVFERTVDCEDNEIIKTEENALSETYELDKCVKWVTENKYQRVCLQFPDALLYDSVSVALYLKKIFGQDFYILADTSYGSCCVDEIACEHINGDSIIHFGHACLSPTSRLPVLYIFQNKKLDLAKFHQQIENVIANQDNVLIFYDCGYYHLHQEISDLLKNYDNVNISKLEVEKADCDKNQTPGEETKTVSGRTIRIKSNHGYCGIFLGPESVTLSNLVLNFPDFKWFSYENDNLKEFSFNQNKFSMQRLYLVEKLKDAKVIGILMGTLGIDNCLEAVARIRTLAKKNGKKCYTLAVGRPNVAKLANFPEIEIFVSVACSENSLSKDSKEYYKPIVSMFEVEMAFGNRKWSTEYSSDFRDLLPGGSFYRKEEENAESDVSLVTNKIRTLQTDLAVEAGSSTLAERESGTITDFSGADYLSNRTWRGLQQNLNQTPIAKAVQGRSGIAYGYENESVTLKDGESN